VAKARTASKARSKASKTIRKLNKEGIDPEAKVKKSKMRKRKLKAGQVIQVKWEEAAAAAAAATASDDYAEKLVEAARAVQSGAADNQAEVDALAKELE
jgi:hypothetical protein